LLCTLPQLNHQISSPSAHHLLASRPCSPAAAFPHPFARLLVARLHPPARWSPLLSGCQPARWLPLILIRLSAHLPAATFRLQLVFAMPLSEGTQEEAAVA